MTDRVIEGILSDAGFRQTNGSSFTEWLAEHDREVARRALFAAADEFLNGHQADKPHDNFRQHGNLAVPSDCACLLLLGWHHQHV